MLIPLGDDLEREHFPFVTFGLITFNALIFAVMFNQGLTSEFYTFEASDQNDRISEFFQTWGLVPNDLAAGNVIGLATNVFLHASIMHVIGNLIVLWAFGQSLETALGSVPFLVLYMFWGGVASLSQCAVDIGSEVPMMGASGAIAGVLGSYMVLFGYAARVKLMFLLGFFPLRFSVPAIGFGGFWILSQLWSASWDATGEFSGVAWMAHIGGFGIGALTMLIFKNQTDRVLLRRSNGTLVFRCREEFERGEFEQERQPETLMTVEELATLPVETQACAKCGQELDKSHQIAQRLLKCPVDACQHLNYVEMGS